MWLHRSTVFCLVTINLLTAAAANQPSGQPEESKSTNDHINSYNQQPTPPSLNARGFPADDKHGRGDGAAAAVSHEHNTKHHHQHPRYSSNHHASPADDTYNREDIAAAALHAAAAAVHVAWLGTQEEQHGILKKVAPPATTTTTTTSTATHESPLDGQLVEHPMHLLVLEKWVCSYHELSERENVAAATTTTTATADPTTTPTKPVAQPMLHGTTHDTGSSNDNNQRTKNRTIKDAADHADTSRAASTTEDPHDQEEDTTAPLADATVTNLAKGDTLQERVRKKSVPLTTTTTVTTHASQHDKAHQTIPHQKDTTLAAPASSRIKGHGIAEAAAAASVAAAAAAIYGGQNEITVAKERGRRSVARESRGADDDYDYDDDGHDLSCEGGATLYSNDTAGWNHCVCPHGTTACGCGCKEVTFVDGSPAFYWSPGSCGSAGCACTTADDDVADDDGYDDNGYYGYGIDYFGYDDDGYDDDGGDKDAASTELAVKAKEWCTNRKDARRKYGNIEDWDVSAVTSFKELFFGFGDDGCQTFTANLNAWDTSNVEDMEGMFRGAKSFNGNLDSWDTSNVVDMSWMFTDAKSFNGNLESWDTSNVEYMQQMFWNAKSFNGNLDSWDTSNVKGMRYMFKGAESFNQDLGRWRFNSDALVITTGMFQTKVNCKFEPPGNYDQTQDRTPTTRIYCNDHKNLFRDGSNCKTNEECDTGSCSTKNQRCLGYAAADKQCSVATNSGGCFVAPTTASSWSTSNASTHQEFPAQMVGNGTQSTVIKWNPVLDNKRPAFDSTDMLTKDGKPLATELTYKLKWLTQEAAADPTAKQIGETVPYEPLSSSDNTSIWDPDDGPGGVGIDCSSGDIFATPERHGTYVAWLIAVDGRGPAKKAGVPPEFDEVLIKQWNLTVTEVINFAVTSFDRLDKSHTVNLELATKMNCSFNEECSIARVDQGSLAPQPASSSKIAYTVEVDNKDGNACDFALLINPDTGYMTGKYNVEEKIMARNQNTTCTATLSAVETNGNLTNLPSQTVKLETFEILFRPADAAVVANGPGGQMCANGGLPVDGTLHDKVFACDCSNSDYEGAACTEAGPGGEACKNGGTVLDVFPFDGNFICNCSGLAEIYNTAAGQCEEWTKCLDGQEESVAPTATNDRVCIALRQVSNQTSTTATEDAAAVGGGVAGALILLFAIAYVYHARQLRVIRLKAHDFKTQLDEMRADGDLPNDINSDNIPREIKRSHVVMTNKIGQGQFGDVYKGLLDESAVGGVPGCLVAVKTTKDTDLEGAAELCREATIMALVERHANIVSLVGVVTSGTPLLLLITFCEHGALSSCLKKKLLPATKSKLSVCLDVVRGMSHLTCNNFVHRDLAARNCLLDSAWTGKVADFGLSRVTAASATDAEDVEMYYKSAKGQFAVRWTSPEAMATLRYTTASDVWSFGVTLHEVYTNGARPYYGMDNEAVINKVQGGYRMPQPDGCPDAVYTTMMSCWNANPMSRPSFAKLEEMLVAADQEHEQQPQQPATVNQLVEETSFTLTNVPTNYVSGIGVAPPAVGGALNYTSGIDVAPTAGRTYHYASATGEEEHESNYNESILNRVISCTAETDTSISPLEGLADTPLVSLREAVATASQHTPFLNNPRLVEAMERSLKFAENLVRRGKSVGLSVDQAAALHMYSQELPVASPFYSAMNGALGGWGSHGGRAAVPHFLPYIKLATSGLALLPKEENTFVYRGVRSIALQVMLAGRGIGDILIWWAFTSTTSCSDVLRDPTFLGMGAEWGERTVFKITSSSGARIKNFSDFGADFEYYLQPVGTVGQNEEELLFPPGTKFMIDGIVHYPNGITEVSMHEVIENTPTGVAATVNAAAAAAAAASLPEVIENTPITVYEINGMGKIKLMKLCREHGLDYKPLISDVDGLKHLLAKHISSVSSTPTAVATTMVANEESQL